MKTARFWTRINGDWVKLSLQDGQSIVHCAWEADEEGFTCTLQQWTRDDSESPARVNWDRSTHAKDCDGRTEEHESLVARLDRLATEDFDGVPCPTWEYLETVRRDHSAERMGY